MHYKTFLCSAAVLALGVNSAFAQLGDFDADGDWDCADIDALTAVVAAGSNDPLFDLDGDGLVDATDGNEWLAIAGAQNLVSGAPYLPGDFGLDGVVDASDFMTWNANKFTSHTGWCQGNVNFDDSTDVSDFNVWNANKFTAAGRLINDSVDPSPIDDMVNFTYDPETGFMTLDASDLDIFCWSVYGAEPEEFLLDVGSDLAVTDVTWIQSFFLGHSKWFSLDNSPLLETSVIARFETGLTAADFEFVSFGTTDGVMGRGSVTIVGSSVVPEPSQTWWILVMVAVACRGLRKTRLY